MGLLAFSVALAVALAIGFAVWRKWIAPWKDVARLADDIVESRPPRKFLISGNSQARRVGLALENLTDRRRELEQRVREGELSVQAVFGAMLDGVVVVDDLRRVRLMNREFRRVFEIDEDVSSGTLLELVRHGSVDRLVMGRSAAENRNENRFNFPEAPAKAGKWK